MENVPLYVSIVIVLITLLTIFFLYKATKSRVILGISIAWLIIHGIIGLSGFYTITSSIPPRFILLIAPPVAAIVLLFLLPAGRKLTSQFDSKWMTWLSVVRLPVEIVLLWLFLYKTIPQLMTFEGRNFDIFSGITAPFIAYFGYTKLKFNRSILLLWNFICLALLLNIVINAIFAAPFPFQKFAFDQPNIAVLYFPFVWLPAFIVPAVLLSHLANIRNLLNDRKRTMYDVRCTPA
ncbi:MAG: hypothetical protein ABIR18_05765 [Chitinophagaceae bacterium]